MHACMWGATASVARVPSSDRHCRYWWCQVHVNVNPPPTHPCHKQQPAYASAAAPAMPCHGLRVQIQLDACACRAVQASRPCPHLNAVTDATSTMLPPGTTM